MSHLYNPLVTVNQLYHRVINNDLPLEIQETIRFYTARLTQAAGVLLRLPQSITAKANVLLFRYWTVDDIMKHEFSDASATTIYLTTKISGISCSLTNIINVYAYLLSHNTPLSTNTSQGPQELDPSSYYVSFSTYQANRTRILHLEGQILNALGFNLHVALPHPLAIIYLQTLDLLTSTDKTGESVALRTIAYLNTALLSPQMLYLTHQPYQLATAAIYLSTREMNIALPECSWWEVFDCEREDVGFLIVAMMSVEALVARERGRWDNKDMILRADIAAAIKKLNNGLEQGEDEDEESRMAKLLDEKVAKI
ncbi:BgtA-21279 [Blumeria graminis f. sp. tritici]|uniref:BgtA-21279 n=2 Tax=Blumeria graminis f. sp. tritici TaxID=62690 RepID=A0A9X9L815_BLUGR|nr:hypothetical protein BGT96224_A21279 [Blumeria graminis f. sp. tritici 96224]VCU39101.1 BgtA-21279 [Blumeria graminis f. sp. tritici]